MSARELQGNVLLNGPEFVVRLLRQATFAAQAAAWLGPGFLIG